MAGNRFPYNMPGHEALVTLINETYPLYDLSYHTTQFGEPFFAPVGEIPGRTYVEADDLKTGRRFWFVYRRLDIAQAFTVTPSVQIEGDITPTRIVQALNHNYGMNFGPDDVRYSDYVMADAGETTIYRVRTLPGSRVWYGEILVECNSTGLPTNVRLLESGQTRLLEDGSIRLLESV